MQQELTGEETKIILSSQEFMVFLSQNRKILQNILKNWRKQKEEITEN